MARAHAAAQIAARAGIHGTDQHEVRWIGGLCVDARDGHKAVLQRLAQRFQHIAVVFGQFIQKQNAVVRLGYFARRCICAAAHQRYIAGGVVRRTERTLGEQPCFGQRARHGMNARGFQRFFERHIRQNRGHAPRHQRLAGAGRADHQNVVPARGSDFQRALGALLPLYMTEIHIGRAILQKRLIAYGFGGNDPFFARQMANCLQKRTRAQQFNAFDAAHFGDVFLRQQHRGDAAAAGVNHHRKCAAHGSQASVQRKLADHADAFQRVRIDLARTAQQTQRDRQIVGGAFLFQIGGREIYRDAPVREFEAAVL